MNRVFVMLNNEGECCYCWSIENPFENPEDKCNFKYQMKYLADQLEAGKVYKLSDIITDKVKKKVSERNDNRKQTRKIKSRVSTLR